MSHVQSSYNSMKFENKYVVKMSKTRKSYHDKQNNVYEGLESAETAAKPKGMVKTSQISSQPLNAVLGTESWCTAICL